MVNINGMSRARARRVDFNHYYSHNLGHNIKFFADYDRPPGRKIYGKGFIFPPYVVFVVVNKNGMSREDLTTLIGNPMPSDFLSLLNSIAKIICNCSLSIVSKFNHFMA